VQIKNASGEEAHPINDGDFTVSAWAKASSLSSGLMEIVSQGQSGSNFYLGSHHTGDRIRAGDNWEDTGVTFPRDDQWHHYVLSRSSSNTYLYLDGSLAATKGSAIEYPDGGSGLRIGRQYGTAGEYFYGSIDEVSIWNNALTTAEVIALYNSGSRLDASSNSGNYVSSSSLVGYWKFNEGTGTSVNDASGNNNGVVNGASWGTSTSSKVYTATLTPIAKAR